jgi:hypothetical protein
LLGFGVNLATSPLAFETIDDFELYYPSIANMTPRAIVSPPDASAGDLLSRMLAAGMSFPAFLRSDIESAAKFVGVDGCIISSASLVEVERIVGSLRKYVRGFRKIIVKEVARIKRAENGKSLEYRAIGVGGGFVTFDYDPEITNLPPPTEYGLVDSAKQALKQLAAGGGNGAVFVDFAVTESRAPMLVECKDFSNGSVNCPVVLATALNRLSE